MTLTITRCLFAFVICLLFAIASAAQPSALPQTGSSTNITPVVTVSPSLLPANRLVEMYLIISNGNPTSTKQIQSGDAFTITVDSGLLSSAIDFMSFSVNSATLSTSDFSITPLGNNQRVIAYTNGTPKAFQPGDSLGLKLEFVTTNTIGSYRITCQGPYVKGASNGRFNEVVSRFTMVQVGTATASSVTSVTASGPLQSIGGTTPNISLTGVVPIANGGTGSATQNFVDLTTTQTVGGAKTFTSAVTANGAGTSITAAGAINTGTQYNISGGRILSSPAGSASLFIGFNAGVANTTGASNTFSGHGAGSNNTTGSHNTFSGASAGANNTTGGLNTFTGFAAGNYNTSGSYNTFSGFYAGLSNTTGASNSFFGRGAGVNNTIGNRNTFVGSETGSYSQTGSDNTFIGYGAASGTNDYTNATAIGSRAYVSSNNSLVLGSINGINGAIADTNVGIGVTSPSAVLDMRKDGGTDDLMITNSASSYPNVVGRRSGGTLAAPTSVTYDDVLLAVIGRGHVGTAFTGDKVEMDMRATENWTSTANGTKIEFLTTANGTTNPVTRMTINQNGFVGIGAIPTSFHLEIAGGIGPATDGVWDFGSNTRRWKFLYATNGTINTSDARLKKQVADLRYGLRDLMQLRPVSFEWKDNTDQRRHLGLLAQETEVVIPEAVIRDKDPAAPLGMSYTELIPVVIKSIQEQQQQASDQSQQIEQLKQQNTQLLEHIEALKKENAANEARLAALEKVMQQAASVKK